MIDTASFALNFAAPEAKLAGAVGLSGARLTEIGLAGGGIVASGVTGDLGAIVNGVAGYHTMMLNWASVKGVAGKVIKGFGYFSGAIGLINDAKNLYENYNECRSGQPLK
jgi:phage gp29-like protein